MQPIEERIEALERGQLSHEQQMSVLRGIALQHMQHNREVDQQLKASNENITMLAGVVGSQGQDIKTILARLDGIDQRLDGLDRQLAEVQTQLASMDQRLDTILTLLSQQQKGEGQHE